MKTIINEYSMSLLALIIGIIVIGLVGFSGNSIGKEVTATVKEQDKYDKSFTKQITPSEDDLSDMDIYYTVKNWQIISGTNINYAKYLGNNDVAFLLKDSNIIIKTSSDIVSAKLDNSATLEIKNNSIDLDKAILNDNVYHKLNLINKQNESTIYYLILNK